MSCDNANAFSRVFASSPLCRCSMTTTANNELLVFHARCSRTDRLRSNTVDVLEFILPRHAHKRTSNGVAADVASNGLQCALPHEKILSRRFSVAIADYLTGSVVHHNDMMLFVVTIQRGTDCDRSSDRIGSNAIIAVCNRSATNSDCNDCNYVNAVCGKPRAHANG